MEFWASMACSTVMRASSASRFETSSDRRFSSSVVSALRLRRFFTDATLVERS